MALGAGGSVGCRARGVPGATSCLGLALPAQLGQGQDRTAHTHQCCMQTELREGGNERLGFFFVLPGCCCPEEEVYGRRELEGFVVILSAKEMPAASSDQWVGRRTES